MYSPESVPENETHKVLWDFEIQTHHLISVRRPDLVIVNKKIKRTCRIGKRPQSKIEKIEKKDFAKELKYYSS